MIASFGCLLYGGNSRIQLLGFKTALPLTYCDFGQILDPCVPPCPYLLNRNNKYCRPHWKFFSRLNEKYLEQCLALNKCSKLAVIIIISVILFSSLSSQTSFSLLLNKKQLNTYNIRNPIELKPVVFTDFSALVKDLFLAFPHT